MNKQQPTTKPQTILQTDTAKYPELSDVQLEVVSGGEPCRKGWDGVCYDK